MIFLPGSVAGSIQTLGIQGDFEVFQTSIYGVSSTVSSWLALSGFGAIPNSANWQIYKPNTGEFLPTTQTDFKYGYLSGGNSSLDASLEPLSARLLVSVSGGSYYSKNVVSLKPYESPLDIPNLQLWLDASDNNTNSSNVIQSGTIPTWNFGIGSQANINHNLSLEMGNVDFTLESWIKTDATAGEKPIISKGHVDNTTFAQYNLYINNNLAVGSVGGGISYNQVVTGTTSIIPDKWYHLVFMRKTGILYLFVNGNLEGSLAQTNYFANSNPLRIGWRFAPTFGSKYFRGDIASIRIIKNNALYPTNSFVLNQTHFPPLLNTGSDTSLLAFQTNPTIQDYSNYNHIITLNGVTTSFQTIT